MTNQPIEYNFTMGNQQRDIIGDIHHNMDIERLTNFMQDHDATKNVRH